MLNQKSWQEIEDSAQPNMFYFDIFLPKLIHLLQDHWLCVKNMVKDYETQIQNFDIEEE
jgi:hypothetical protein